MSRIVAAQVPLAAERALAGCRRAPAARALVRGPRRAAPPELGADLRALVPPTELRNAQAAAALLADHIAAGRKLLIVADYDCDGATACAVGLRALTAFGANVDYFVPNRFETATDCHPRWSTWSRRRGRDLLITVDNGIASVDGVARARAHGIGTLITDHHLPGDDAARRRVHREPEPAGLRVSEQDHRRRRRDVLRDAGVARRAPAPRPVPGRTEPNLASLLDLVALGTVADVVRLDRNNRILVEPGRAADARRADAAGDRRALRHRRPRPAAGGSFDLGFALGPRINAAGRLADMRVGIEALATDDYARALNIARDLDRLNRERREVEESMRRDADALVAAIVVGEAASLVLYDEGWHQGVIGLARRPPQGQPPPSGDRARAGAGGGLARGSGRSIPGLHLRDALDLVSKRAPDLLIGFGGHAAAAGLTMRARDVERFAAAFDGAVREMCDPALLAPTVETDGSLEPEYATLELARALEAEVWGQGFPPPRFADEFTVESQRLVGEKHLRAKLARAGRRYDAIAFRHDRPLPERVRAAYALAIDDWNGAQGLELRIEHAEDA